jgi:AcrR family transcriptional regulator
VGGAVEAVEQGKGRAKTAGGVRARVRAEMITEIKATARRHLATDGANLSLRAIAREMGMVSSALYRYFAGRDELLTALILDAYDDLGAAAEAADASIARDDVRGRWMAVTRSLREWALAHPAEYALIYGSPVPGYAAPAETTAAALRAIVVLVRIMSDAAPLTGPSYPFSPALAAEIARVRTVGADGLDDAAMARGMVAWTELFGAISFELFGRLNNVVDQRAEWFDVQMTAMLDYIGV